MATVYDSTVTVRMKPEVRNIIDMIQEKVGIKSIRALQETMIPAYLEAYSFILAKRIEDHAGVVPALEKKIADGKKELESTSDLKRKAVLEGEIGAHEMMLVGAQHDAIDLKELLTIFNDIQVKADPILPIVDFNNQYSMDRATDELLKIYQCKKYPCVKRTLEMNGFLSKASQEDQE